MAEGPWKDPVTTPPTVTCAEWQSAVGARVCICVMKQADDDTELVGCCWCASDTRSLQDDQQHALHATGSSFGGQPQPVTCWPTNGDAAPLPCTAEMGVVGVLQTFAGGDCGAGGGCTAGGCGSAGGAASRPQPVSVWPAFAALKLEGESAVHAKSEALQPVPFSCSDAVSAPVPACPRQNTGVSNIAHWHRG